MTPRPEQNWPSLTNLTSLWRSVEEDQGEKQVEWTQRRESTPLLLFWPKKESEASSGPKNNNKNKVSGKAGSNLLGNAFFWIGLLAGWLGIIGSISCRHPHRHATPTQSSSAMSLPTMAPTLAQQQPRSCPLHFVNNPGTIATGDHSRPDFAARLDENLVLCEGFDTATDTTAAATMTATTARVWQADKSLFGEGNGGFAYYTPENVVHDNGALQIRPGLFQDLGMITTKGGLSYPAGDVMVGNCTPFPACATLDLTDQNCTISEFSGCERIGTPLVALNPVTSGRITTKGRFEMMYGRLEARIRLPQGDWLWPALWMMPVNESKYGVWPDSGEFDILESKGNDPNVFGRSGAGRNMFSSCLHYSGNSWWKTRNSLSAMDIIQSCRNGTVPLEECDWSTDYFTIGLYWSPTRMYTYALRESNVAGETIQEEEEEEVIIWDVNATQGFGPNDYPLGSNFPPFSNEENTLNQKPQGPYVDESPNNNAPFDQPFYLILNLNVGGEINGCPNPGYWGPEAVWCTQADPEVASRTTFWNSRDLWYPSWQEAKEKGKDAFAVDWIKVWQ
jgi:Glycosyl hydrolases family 16